MFWPRTVTFEIGGQEPSNPTRPPNCTRPPPIVAVRSSRRTPRSSKATVPLIESSALGSEKWRMRPSLMVALPENTGCRSGPSTAAVSSARPDPRTSRKNALEDAEVRVARHLQPDALVYQTHRAGDAKTRLVSDELEIAESDPALVERQPDRRRVPHRVVEQPHVERVDRALRRQALDVGERARDAYRAARDRSRGRREVRHEQADILIDRAVVKPQANLRVALRIEGDPPGAGHRQPRRRRVDLAAQVRAPERKLAGDLAHGFAGHRQIADAEPVIVTRLVERAVPARRQFHRSGQGPAGVGKERDCAGGNPPAVHVEGVCRIPTDERRPRDRAVTFGDLDGVEPHAGTVEAQRRRRLLDWLAVRHAVLDRHGAGADRAAALALQDELACHPARQRVLVDLKRVAQAVEIAAPHAEPRINFVAAVLTRGREREQAVGVNFRTIHPHDRVADL